MTDPISPDDIKKSLPEEVIQVVNELLQQKWDGREAILKLGEVRSAIAEKMGIQPSAVKQMWLDFEVAYRNVGWSCLYHKPSYDEKFESYYQFKKRQVD